MHSLYEDYLFSLGYLVADDDSAEAQESHPAEALIALASYAEIRITQHPELANPHMVEVAARNLGKDVPAPFYRMFPESARKLTPNQALLDQLVNYFFTYDLGDFSHPRHSLLEEYYERSAFAEDVTPKLFAIITPEEAQGILARAVDGLLASTRPLNDGAYALLLKYLTDTQRPVTSCGSKDTACRLFLDTHDQAFVDLLQLPDVIRLVEWILHLGYPDMTIRKLNLKNQDRKLITQALDRLFERGACDVAACLEKKRVWNGLLHHIHYRPACEEARAFCTAIRGHEARSRYARFEEIMAAGDVCSATDALRASKGSGAVLRNLAYLLSRCDSLHEVDYVLDAVAKTNNKLVLIQLLTHFYTLRPDSARIFRFAHLGLMKKHTENQSEIEHRKSILDEVTAERLLLFLEERLKDSCRGTLGKVYVDDAMRCIALPLQEATAQSGYGTLPTGSRLPVSTNQILRAFIYWEKIDDIDLSCFALDEEGHAQEFSWRTMSGLQSEAVAFSGDQVSGYYGGSEFYDIDTQHFKAINPDSRFLTFSANVYSRDVRFSDGACRAGYMLRDRIFSGEVFEPKTVKSSFAINCPSSAAYLFALDLVDHAIVWLNVAEQSTRRVAGEGDMTFLLKYLHLTEAINLFDFARMLATRVVDTPEEADVIFSDDAITLADGQEQIHSYDTIRVLELLNS